MTDGDRESIVAALGEIKDALYEVLDRISDREPPESHEHASTFWLLGGFAFAIGVMTGQCAYAIGWEWL